MKKFNIHDWQAKQRKQRLNEEFDPSAPNSQDLTLAPEIAKFIGQTFASWMSPSHPEFSKEYAKPQYIDKLVGGIMDIIEIRMMGGVNEMSTTSTDNLEVIKKGRMIHLNKYFEDIGRMKLGDGTINVGYAKMDLVPGNLEEMNTTGGGASFQAGAGEAYATPKAFKKKNKED